MSCATSAQSLTAFWTDLGDRMAKIPCWSPCRSSAAPRARTATAAPTTATPTSCSSSAGRCTAGKVYGQWPGLDQSQLYEGRDLALTTDFRHVLGEGVQRHLGNKDLATIFPGFENDPRRFLRLLG